MACQTLCWFFFQTEHKTSKKESMRQVHIVNSKKGTVDSRTHQVLKVCFFSLNISDFIEV